MGRVKPAAETRRDIEEDFAKWDVDEFRIIPPRAGSAARVIYFDRQEKRHEMACARFDSYAQNLRAVAGIIREIRLADQRGILVEFARAAAEAAGLLTSGRYTRPPHEVLGVMPNATRIVSEAAFKALANEAHPDKGGSDEAMKELNAAIEEFRARQAVE